MISLQYLKVVVCFITLTDLTKFWLNFCVDEVFEDRGAINMRRIKRGKSSSLGMPKAPQVNISKDTQASKLGDAPVGIPSFFFNKFGIPRFLFCSHDLCPLCFSFYLRTMLVWDVPSSIYRILHVHHLYLLSMIL